MIYVTCRPLRAASRSLMGPEIRCWCKLQPWSGVTLPRPRHISPAHPPPPTGLPSPPGAGEVIHRAWLLSTR